MTAEFAAGKAAQVSGHYRAGVDIGGTFTDLVVVDDETGEFAIGKTLTTPRDPSQAVEHVLSDVLLGAGIAFGDIRHLVHGTTLVTNAIIERSGALTALLTSQGFRDCIEIGRENRYDLYDLSLELPPPLVPRYLRFDVPQRTLADGSTYQELDTAFVGRLARELAENGVTAVAVSFLHSFRNPRPEQEARDAVLRAAPDLHVSISSEVAPEIREYERTSTTIANVYVQALVERYLRELQVRLVRRGFGGHFFVMLSSGGIATVETATRFPIRLLESGPAAGALAAAAYGKDCGYPNLLSFDMGGTTAKLCAIEDGRPRVTFEFEVDRKYRFKRGSGLPIKTPVIEMIEIGAGGGSIACIDDFGLLKVGPASAGADPGPACYMLGGIAPTVTDANVVLGYLDPRFFLGGRMALGEDAARVAIDEHIARALAVTVEVAAWGICQIVNENMANAARVHATERGMNPRGLPLFAFGGAGPLHACAVARLLGAPLVVAPLGAGVMSTVGFLAAPLAFDFSRSWQVPLEGADWNRANALFASMEGEGRAILTASGLTDEAITHTRSADMRYIGQGHEVRVPVPSRILDSASAGGLRADFEHAYLETYGRQGPPVAVEIVNWRVVSSGPNPALRLSHSPAGGTKAATALKGYRRAYCPVRKRSIETPVYDRYLLAPGGALDGPAIVEERESTLIMGLGDRACVDERLNLVVDIGEQVAHEVTP